MRVILVNRFATVAGGAEKHAVGLARILRARGDEVRFLSTAGEGNIEREGAFVPPPGTDFWRGAPGPRERLEVAASAFWNRRAAAATSALIADFRPDVVHAHDLYPQLSAAPVCVAARRGVPVVQTLHNYELISASPVDDRGGWRDAGDAPASVRWLRAALKQTRARLHAPRVGLYVAVSKFVARAYAPHGIDAEVLPNFTDSAPVEGPGFAERSGILFAGRLAPEKGVRDVIALARQLPDVPVTIAGRGLLEPEALAAAAEVPNLDYAGELSGAEVDRRLAASRLAVLPARWQEPAGLVALEAMAQGTPIVAYDAGGLAEYVSDAGAGTLVPPHDRALAKASAELYRDPEAWSRFAARGREAVATTHSPRRYGERIAELYRRVARA